MNDGFVRCARLFLQKIISSFVMCLICTVFVCIYFKSNLNENLTGIIAGAVAGAFSSVVTILPIQHMYIYKTVRTFGITRKNYSLASYITNVMSSLIFTAIMWLILYFTNIFEFTSFIAVIVFLMLVFFWLLAEFCGLLIYKGNAKIGFGVSFLIYIACICVPISMIFSNSVIPLNSYLIVICVISIALCASLFVMNTLIARNLELQN